MAGDFDESQHPRADDGKFGGGGGGSKPRGPKAAATVSKAKTLIDQRKAGALATKGFAKPTAEQSAERIEKLKSGFMPWVTPAERDQHVAKEHADIKNEGEMLEAGHVNPVPTEKLEEYRKVRETTVKRLQAVTNNLDAAHHEAMQAVGKLEALSDYEHRELRNPVDHDELSSRFAGASSTLHEAVGKESNEAFDKHRDDHDFEPIGTRPGKHAADQYDSTEEHAKAIADHDAAFAERKALHHQAAEHAQNALEKLQGEQAKAHDALKKIEVDHGKAFREMLDEAGDHGDGEDGIPGGVSGDVRRLLDEHHDDDLPAHADRAADAARSMAAHAKSERQQHESPFEGGADSDDGTNLDEARRSVRGSMRETGKAIKQLAKVTGRAPKAPTASKATDDDDQEG